ncbi:MAG: membrane protein insertase YidC [Proteobacteria bacterium]|nr:membrane protein insertase YidC [Pseudomonadota bacterium]
MLSSEVQRIVLLVGLAVTGYLMILAWNDDYISAPRTQALPEAPTRTSVTAPVSVSDLPVSGSVTESSSNLDIPQVGPSDEANQLDPGASGSSSGQLVTVFTPSLNIWIDLVGGDIVRVELPAHPLEIDKPEVPYLLLNNTGGYTYVAQSGLVGPDGLDSSEHRPVYKTTKTEYVLEKAATSTSCLLPSLKQQRWSKHSPSREMIM